MSAIKSSSVEIMPLRGMDQRWLAKANKARLITDMTWSSQDAWRQAGGFDQCVPDYYHRDIKDEDIEYYRTSVSTFTIPAAEKTVITSDRPPKDADEVEEEVEPSYPTDEKGTVIQETFKDSDLESQYREVTGPTDPSKSNPYDRHPVPVSLHWFAQYNGAIQWLLYETADGGMYHFYGAGAPFTPWRVLAYVDGKLFDGLTLKRTMLSSNSWSGTHYQCFGGNVYFINGYDEPMVFDGRKVSRAGFGMAPSNLDADIVHDDADANYQYAYIEKEHIGVGNKNDKTWEFGYKVTFVNERGQESPYNEDETTKFQTNTATQRSLVTLTIPTGPVGTVARRIYRTQNLRDGSGETRDKAFADEFYFLEEIQDNITTIYVDGRKDLDLGMLRMEEDYGLWPSSSTRITSFKGTMFIANSKGSTVRYSFPRAPEEFPELNSIEIGDANAGPITAMYTTKNALLVFKSRGIYLVKGDPAEGFFAMTLTRDVGCISSKSIREMPGQGLVFMGNDGLYLLEGALENTGTITGVVRIGEPIQQELDRMNTSAVESIRTAVNIRDREFWMAIPTKGSTVPNRLLKYHYEIGEWSVAPDFHVYDMIATEDHRAYIYIASSVETKGNRGLMVYSRAYTEKAGYAVAPLYKSVFMSPNSVYSAFHVVRVLIYCIGYGDNDLKANLTVNRELNTAYTTDLSRDQKRPLEDASAPKYGSSTWGGTSLVYSEHRPVPVRFDLSTQQKGPVQELSFEFSPAGSRIQIIGYRMDVRIGGRRQVLPLVDLFGKGV